MPNEGGKVLFLVQTKGISVTEKTVIWSMCLPLPPARSPEFAFTDTYFPPSNLVVDKCVRLSKEASLNPSPQPSSQISATLNHEVI